LLPDLSRDDTTLVFVRPGRFIGSGPEDTHFVGGSLFTSSFDPKTNAIGPPMPLIATPPGETHYYPSFSPDKSFVVFNAISNTQPNDDIFYDKKARVVLVHYPPMPNDKPIELPSLNAKGVSDQLTNSWPKWSP